MPYGLYLSAAGAHAQSHRLEVLSHNLANVNTPGFKPHLSVLKARHTEGIERGDSFPDTGGIDDIGGGVTIQPNETVFSQGAVRPTGIRTDFAINDEQSFFVVTRQGEQHLTRAGNFLFNKSGQLVSESGDPVLSTAGAPLTIEPGVPYEVHDDGSILQAGQRQSIMLARPKEVGDLSRVGDNLYRPLGAIAPVPIDQRQVIRDTWSSQQCSQPLR